jgi:hypothetical protein
VTGNSAAYGQSGAGSVQGTVTDSTRAVIQGAAIHIVNQATGIVSDAKTNDVGFYLVPDLFTGTYAVTVTASHMKIYSQTIDLQAGQHAVINPQLTAGAETQQVTVHADAVQLVTYDSGTLSSTIENERINQIPMNTREVVTLAQMTTPGLEALQSNGTRADGMMMEALEYVADGAPLDNRNFGGPNASVQGQFPDADSVQEMHMVMTDGDASYATPATGILTTKSGTNTMHGSFFETAVNSYWGTAKNRNQSSAYRELPYVRNEFGLSAGGPITLPHLYHGKDRSFWFFAFERYSLASTTTELVSVPDSLMESGNFSEAEQSGTAVQLYDPATTFNSGTAPCPGTPVTTANPTGANAYCRTPFGNGTAGSPGNNQITASRISPLAKTLYGISPAPNNTNNPFVSGNLDAPDVSFVTVPTMTFRIDQNFSEKNKMYLRFTGNWDYNRALRNYPNNSPATIAGTGFPSGASGYQIIPVTNFSTAVGYTHVFSPTFYSEMVASQQWFRQYVGGGGNPNLDYDTELGLPNNFGETGFPVISGMATYQYGGTQYQYEENQIISTLDDNLTKTYGKHQMQFGGRFRHERLYYLNSRNADTAAFNNGEGTGLENPATGTNYTALSFTGQSDADFFLGDAGSYSVQLEPPPSWYRDFELDAYYQDGWHISRNLTLNLGVRYEAHPARQVRQGVTDSFDLVNHALVLGAPISSLISEGWTTQNIINNMTADGVKFETASQAGMPASLIDNANLIVLPRFSFAWTPFGNKWGTVLRGGYGRYAFPYPTRSSNPGPTNVPFAYGYTQNYNAANQSPDGAANYLLRENYNSANPNAIVAGANSANVIGTNFTSVLQPTAIVPGFGFTVYSPDYKPDEGSKLNFTVEQALKGDSALRFSYVWSHESYVDRIYYPNTHPSTFIWELENGIDPPTGGGSVIGTSAQNTYAATATGPYDNTVYGNFGYGEKNGWSNTNEFMVNYQRVFHHGIAYQIYYVWDKTFRVGDNSSRDSQGYDYLSYQGVANNPNVTITSLHPYTTPAIPPKPQANAPIYADYKALDVFEDYKIDGSGNGLFPHHIQFTYIYDLPFGRGKMFLGKANRLVDELVGGYQLAGDGTVQMINFQPASGNWGATSPIQVYKHKMPVTDCTSGNCYKEYLWFNGYIAPTQNASSGYCTTAYGAKVSASGVLECVYGLPTNYQAYESPINTVPELNGNAATGDGANYNTNNVTLSGAGLKAGGEIQGFGPTSAYGANPYVKTFIHGPFNWDSDMSLYKVFPITERFNLRFNMDVFNFLNHQGWNNPASTTTGLEYYAAGGSSGASSYNPPRQVQFTLRLSF